MTRNALRDAFSRYTAKTIQQFFKNAPVCSKAVGFETSFCFVCFKCKTDNLWLPFLSPLKIFWGFVLLYFYLMVFCWTPFFSSFLSKGEWEELGLSKTWAIFLGCLDHDGFSDLNSVQHCYSFGFMWLLTKLKYFDNA